VRRPSCLLVSLALLACTDGAVDSGAKLPAVDVAPSARAGSSPTQSKELIPAEWTVFEDTAATGEVMTASLQLPAAQDIEGLGDQDGPRLVLRCVDGKVQASIDTEGSDTVRAGSDSVSGQGQSVEIQLDSVPACE
jgi:hypothetical protein